MKPPSAEQMDLARHLVAHEVQGVQRAEEQTAAAGRVHPKIYAHLARLLGVAGARALYARSVKLAAPEFPCLRGVDFDAESTESSAEQLAACLRAETPAAATETAVALCARVLALLTTMIGERLTFQVLRVVWPTMDLKTAPPEESE